MSWIKVDVKEPVLEKGVHWLTQAFGNGHNGVDLIGKGYATDWIISIAAGKVEECSYSESRGYYVGIRINKNYLVRYLHMKEGSIQVKKGDTVIKGQRIGFMGNTGYTVKNGKKKRVGTHLHLAVVYKGNFVNPLPYLEGTKKFTDEKPVDKIQYQVSLKNSDKYLPKVEVGSNDYAGILGNPIDCLKIEQLTYRVQAEGRINYYPYVTGCSDKLYAGVQGKGITKLQIKGKYKYRVHIITDKKKGTGKWLSWVTGDSDYAGWKNYLIDGIQIKKA
jgi:hypothetical protein